LIQDKTKEQKATDYIAGLIKNDEKYQNVKIAGVLPEQSESVGGSLNKLIEASVSELVCVFDASYMVSKNWLFDLLAHLSISENGGVSAIPVFQEHRSFISVIDNSGCFMASNNPDHTVNGILFFNKQTFEQSGKFPELPGMSMKECQNTFCKQVMARTKKSCFYVPEQIALCLE
jgi:cellulose synthase/poly-beta-1,6-N-acetylglucosamine synthase-like glycosyltransferase